MEGTGFGNSAGMPGLAATGHETLVTQCRAAHWIWRFTTERR